MLIIMRIVVFASVAGLTGCSSSSNGDSDGSPPPGDFNPGDSKLPPPQDLGKPSPTTFPTFVNLDWDGFPKDPGPSYPVKGRLWVVKTTGNDGNPGTEASPKRSIAAALGSAKTGDVVRVHGGSYSELWPDDFRAIVLKTPGVTLTSAPGETVTVTSSENYGIAIEANDIVVNGINLEGFTYGIQVGLTGGQRNVVISNLTVAGSSGDSEGIIAYDTGGSTPVSDGLLIKNVVVKNTVMGISCNSGPCKSWMLDNVHISAQGGSGSGADAVAVESGDNFFFHRVEATGASGDGIDTKATRVVVWACNVHHVKRNGVKLWHGGDVVNTLIHHTGADAALVTENGPKTRLLHTLVTDHNKGGDSGYHMTFGYDSQAKQTIEIINSIIGRSNGGTYINNASTVRIENSVFFSIDNDSVVQTGKGSVSLSDGAGAISAKGLGGANIFADPKLDSGYHLLSGSPAANKGKKLQNHPANDNLGRPRIKGAGPDIGPFEDH